MNQLELDQLPFSRKIDYYSGAQGNFLQCMLALNSNPDVLDLDNLFDNHGACHSIFDPEIQPNWQTQIGTAHFSQLGLPIGSDDLVVEIHVPKNYYIIVMINFFLRAPYHPFDIMEPHVDTMNKLDQDPRKMESFKQRLLHSFGAQANYEEWHWRFIFYQEFLRPDAERNQFNHVGRKHIMEFDCFFDFQQFCGTMKKISGFLGLPYQYNADTEMTWIEYMRRNQGLAAKLRCDQILQELQHGRTVDLSNLDLVSQSWIIYCCFGRSAHLAMPWIKKFPKRSDDLMISLNDQMLSESQWLELARR